MGASILAVVCFLLQLTLLPRIAIDHGVSIKQFFEILRSPKIVAILLTVVFVVTGQYSGYTFISPYLQQITQVHSTVLSGLLLAYGIVSIVGNFVGGTLAGRSLYKTVAGTVWLYFASLAVLSIFGDNLVVSIVALLVWALSWGMALVGTQLWLHAATLDMPEAAQAMNTSLFQLSIGLGSLIGGIAVNSISLRSSMYIGATILILAVIMVYVVGSINRRSMALVAAT